MKSNKLPPRWVVLTICLTGLLLWSIRPKLSHGQGAIIMGCNEAAALTSAAEEYFANKSKLPQTKTDLQKSDLLPDQSSRVSLVVTSPDSIEIRYSGYGSPRNSPRQINRKACRRLQVLPDGTLNTTGCYEGIRWWRFW